MKIIALDIDGPLNTPSDFEKLVEHGLVSENYRKLNLKHFRRGDFVNLELLDNLHQLVRDTGAGVLGISSWFKPKDPEHNERVAEFLGVPLVGTIGYTGGGLNRVLALSNWCLDYQPTGLTILDDQTQGYDVLGFTNHRVEIVRGGFSGDLINIAKNQINRKILNWSASQDGRVSTKYA